MQPNANVSWLRSAACFQASTTALRRLAMIVVAGSMYLSTAAAQVPEPLLAGTKAKFRDSPNPGKDSAIVGFSRDAVLSSLEDPTCKTSQMGALLRLSSSEQTNALVHLPCENWSASGSGYRYRDRDGLHGGVQRVTYKTSKLSIKAKGLQYDPPITGPLSFVEVRFDVGARKLCGRFASFRRNDAAQVRATRPSEACEIICGDNILEGDEACDDGNLADGDGCDSNCMPTGCGNGIVTAGEACDDGNLSDGDGCDSNCTTTACSNGVITTCEACDDGNAVDGDGCDNDCIPTSCTGSGGPGCPTQPCATDTVCFFSANFDADDRAYRAQIWLETSHVPFVGAGFAYVVARFGNDLGAELEKDFILTQGCGPGLGFAFVASLTHTEVLSYGPLELEEILFDNDASIAVTPGQYTIPETIHDPPPPGWEVASCDSVSGSTVAYTALEITSGTRNYLNGYLVYVSDPDCPTIPDLDAVLTFYSGIQMTLVQEGTGSTQYVPLAYNVLESASSLTRHWYSLEFVPPPIERAFSAPSWLGGEWHQDVIRLVGIDPTSAKGDFMLYQKTINGWPSLLGNTHHLNVVERDAAYWNANIAAAQTLEDAGWEFFLKTTFVDEAGSRGDNSVIPVPASSLGLTQPGTVNLGLAWARLPATCRANFLNEGQRTLTLDINYVTGSPPSAAGLVGVGGTSDSCRVKLPAVGLESERHSARFMMHEMGHCLFTQPLPLLSPCLEPYRTEVLALFFPPYAGGPTCPPTVGTVTGYESGSVNENLSNYVFDPERFRARITEDLLCGSSVLLQKYEFWRDNFYAGVEFCGLGSDIYECTVDPPSYIP